MRDTALLWTLSALVVLNTIIVVLAYVSAARESKEHSEAPRTVQLRQMARRLWLHAMSKGVMTRKIAFAAALGSLWSLIWFQGFGTLAIPPGVALAALILMLPWKAVLERARQSIPHYSSKPRVRQQTEEDQ